MEATKFLRHAAAKDRSRQKLGLSAVKIQTTGLSVSKILVLTCFLIVHCIYREGSEKKITTKDKRRLAKL